MGDLAARLTEAMQAGSATAYALAFVVGVFISFTPCVYPAIPLIVGYIGNAAGGHRLNAFLYSLTYVFGMALVYSALGVLAGAGGGIFGRQFSNPWLLLPVGNFFIVMGAWALGLFAIPTPKFMSGAGGNRRKGLLGSFVVGATSGLVVAPCATPALFAILAVIAGQAQAKTPVAALFYGGTVMFAMALGMGLLLLVCGTFSGILASLPRPGRWLNATKKVLAGVLVLMGGFFVMFAGQQIAAIPSPPPGLAALLVGLGALALLAGVFLALRRAFRTEGGVSWTWLAAGLSMLVVGEALLLAGAQGMPPMIQLFI